MDLVQAATHLQDEIRERAPEIEGARRLPADLAQTLASAGMFRQLVPRSVGGLEVTAAEFSKTLELVSAADASVGWCVMIGSTAGLNAAYLPINAARSIFDRPEIIAGGVFAPKGKGGHRRRQVAGQRTVGMGLRLTEPAIGYAAAASSSTVKSRECVTMERPTTGCSSSPGTALP